MSLQEKVMTAIKGAMKEKNQEALAALRAIKSEILLAQTASGSKEELTSEEEIKILSKLVKQRKDMRDTHFRIHGAVTFFYTYAPLMLRIGCRIDLKLRYQRKR